MSGPKTERYLRALEEKVPGETLSDRRERIGKLHDELFYDELCRCAHTGADHSGPRFQCARVACGCLMFRERERCDDEGGPTAEQARAMHSWGGEMGEP